MMKYVVIGFAALFVGVIIVGLGGWFIYNYWYILILVAVLAGVGIFYHKKHQAEANRV